MTERPAHPIYRRSTPLVLGILGYVADSTDPVPWDDLLRAFHDAEQTWKTIENTIRDLENFGALHRIGKADRRRGDTRALHATPLGLAWLDRELLPLPGQPDDDPFDLADEIADTREDLADTLEALRPDPFAANGPNDL